MSTQKELENAIHAVENQRGRSLEDETVELALLALREKLLALQAPPTMQQRDAVCVLVADMSGFTSMSEFLDAEEVRDTINAVWQRLDRIILNWGGEIDKHLGDGVIALFGLSRLQEDDARRAVLAALDMQAELALFDEQQGERVTSHRGERHTPQRSRVQMRVGLHIGPVYFGQVGIGDEVTTMGDTIEIANRLEEMAPVGGVLISSELYERVYPFFEADEYEPTAVGAATPPSFVVRREIPSSLSSTDAHIPMIQTRFVGRADELDLLQHTLQQVIDNNQAQIISIVGEAGVGKSRLAYEFERLITLLPDSICLMKGVAQTDINHGPYSLLRSLFSHHFGIHTQHSPLIAREKLVRTILNRLHDDYDRAKLVAEQIPQLLGFGPESAAKGKGLTAGLEPESGPLAEANKRDREAGFESLVHLLTAVGEKRAATVLFLEDFHAADEGSYDFLDYLMQVSRHQPLLLICLTRPSLFDKRPSWRMAETTERQEIHLQPLSPIDSRHLLTELLQKIEAMPLRLMDVISHSAGGNPFHLHAVVQAFVQERVIETEEGYWQANMGRLLDLPSPPTLFNLWQDRLHHLPLSLQKLLQRAAIFGQTFWDAGLLALTAVEESSSLAEVNDDLQRLVADGWVQPKSLTAVANCRQYSFCDDYLQEVVYQTISESTRAHLHTQVAAWLLEQQLPSSSRLWRLIAFQFEQAGKRKQARQWYGRAAQHAQSDLALETATAYYSRALSQLEPEQADETAQFELLNGLAASLRKQARLTDSIAMYRRVQQLATEADEPTTAVEAALNEFYCHFVQEDLRDALESIRPAENMAHTLADSALNTMLVTARGWLALLAGQNKMASDRAREMYSHSRSLAPSSGWALSRAFMGDLAREMNRYQQASEAVNMARDMFASFGDTMWQALLTIQLGRIAAEQWQIETAVGHYQQAIRFARNHGERFCLMMAMRELGQIYRQQHRYEKAETYYLHALSLAERSQNQTYLAHLAIDLGQLYLAQALNTPQNVQEIAHQEQFTHEASRWFSRGLRLARKVDKPLLRALALMGQAKIEVQEHLLESAQEQAQEAVLLMERLLQQRPIKSIKQTTAVAWRVLGHTLAKVPHKKQQTAVGGKLVDAIACFMRSNELLKEVGVSGNLERAFGLRAWALLELRRDHLTEATNLAESARELLLQLGLSQDANQIKDMMRSG